MATATELLINNEDVWFEVDLLSRRIVIPNTITNLGTKNDKNVMHVRFKLPRFYHDVDFSDFEIGIDYTNAKGEEDRYEPEDVAVDDNIITFTWIVGRHAALYDGNVTFGLCAKRLNPDNPDDPENEFHTTPVSLPILDSMETCEEVIVEHVDLLEQWRQQLFERFVTDEQVEAAVNKYLEENPIDSGAGVYVGSGEMPDNCNVQIDPSGNAIDEVLLCTEQTLTPEQQAQARENIGAIGGVTAVHRKNLLDPNNITIGGWHYKGVADMYPTNTVVKNYCFTDYIPVVGGETYVYSGCGVRVGTSLPETRTYLHSFSFFDKDKGFISSHVVTFSGEFYLIDVPETSAYIIINDSSYTCFLNDPPQLEKGETPTEYEAYIPEEKLTGYYLPDLKVKAEQIEDFVLPETEYNILHLPEKYDLVVGDTFELFYKGVMLCKDPYHYNIHVQCDIGKAWGRKFEVTPTTVGNHTLRITISDDTGKVLDTGRTILSVSQKMTAPSKNINVLCIGDSLTNGGVWVDEVYRRLTKTNDKTMHNNEAPTGEGLSNITFVGKRKTTNGAGYEGFGGWRFSNYNNTSTTLNAYWVTATHNKTESDQESVYKDGNGVQWQLETIEAGRLKFKKYAGEGTLVNNGTLTWVSGGVNTDAIHYSAVSPEEGNPFVYSGAVDFAAYCDDIGASGIDKCFILLGWNNAATSEDEYKAEAKTFIDKLIAFNSNIKITLIGLQIPSLDGCANNYGASGTYANYRGLQEFVFNLDHWYSDIAAEYPNNVDTINLSGQFDTEHNALTAEFTVNARNPEKVTVQSNGVHPSTFGYYQIADAVYRKFTADN